MTTDTAIVRGFQKLSPDDLFSLEQYSKQRPQFRPQVLAHKRRRTLQVGPNATILFEDRLTVQYQVQEMLRIERIFESAGIADELGAYNPLIPDGSNWKGTLLIEYPDPEERKVALAGLKGVERENDEKTSAVHFVRFELSPAMVATAKAGAAVSVGIDHPNYRHAVEPVAPEVRDALVADLA